MPALVAEGLELLRQTGQVTVCRQEQGATSLGEEFLQALPHADAVVVSPWFRPASAPADWNQAKAMKVLAVTADNRLHGWIDFRQLESRGVVIVDTSRGMTPSVAEFALALTLNLLRDIPNELHTVREGRWADHPVDLPGYVYGDLTGRHVGLAGFGSINRRYCELLEPFRCQVAACDPFVTDQTLRRYAVERSASLTDLAARSEIFVVGIPPTPSTESIIDRQVIEALPRGSLFVLVTRMRVVEQTALWQRAQAGEIRAAVDVFAPEPPPADAWFRRHQHVVASPHIAGGTLYCHRRCFVDACKDAVAVLEGRQPRFRATQRDVDLYRGRGSSQV